MEEKGVGKEEKVEKVQEKLNRRSRTRSAYKDSSTH